MNMLLCPYCQHRFSLSWRSYCLALNNQYRCPACGQKAYVKTDPAYVSHLSLALQALPFVLPAMLQSSLGAAAWWALLLWLPISALDKYLDERFGILCKLD